MRISDWSSDVCSSDLTVALPGGVTYPTYSLFVVTVGLIFVSGLWFLFNRTRAGKIMRAAALDREMAQVLCINTKLVITAVFAFGAWLAAVGGVVAAPMRSEAHTSELQSLMRISYAVFCLKKKNNSLDITHYLYSHL